MCPTKPTLGRSRPGTEATKRLPTSVGRRFEEPAAQEAWRTTLPALMHEVQAFTRLGVPPTRVRTVWMLGFQRRRVRRCEWETLLPNPGPLPQTSQTEATVTPFKRSGSRTSPHAKGRPTERSCEQVGAEVTNRGRIHEEHGPTRNRYVDLLCRATAGCDKSRSPATHRSLGSTVRARRNRRTPPSIPPSGGTKSPDRPTPSVYPDRRSPSGSNVTWIEGPGPQIWTERHS